MRPHLVFLVAAALLSPVVPAKDQLAADVQAEAERRVASDEFSGVVLIAQAGKPIVIASGRGLAYGPESGNVDHELAALNQLFVESMQMTVYPVLAELTLADRVVGLAAYAAQGAASLAAAEAEIDRLLTELG